MGDELRSEIGENLGDAVSATEQNPLLEIQLREGKLLEEIAFEMALITQIKYVYGICAIAYV